MKLNILIFTLLIGSLLVMNGCGDDSFSCEDGKQNQGETGIDCGGPCPNCAYMRTCTDGIQNGEELGVDCGGPCPAACPDQPTTPVINAVFEAEVNGTAWSAKEAGGDIVNETLTISGLDSDGIGNDFTITITYSEEFTTRSGNFDMITNTAFITGTGINGDCIAQTGTVTFSKFDMTNRLVSGTFSFTCQDADGIEVAVSNGKFENIPF
ncbi:MAG: DUF6252 family protein [Chitinophagales bacterium]